MYMRIYCCFALIPLLLQNVLASERSVTSDRYNAEINFVEGNAVEANISLEAGMVDNFLNANNDKQNTAYFQVAPDLILQAQSHNDLFQLGIQTEFIKFNDFSDDDHNDYSLMTKYHHKFSNDHKVFITGSSVNYYEYRGTGVTLGDAESIDVGDEISTYFVNGGYMYGNDTSVGRFKILYGKRSSEYDTRRSVTNVLDLTSSYIQGEVDYLISGKSFITTNIQYEDIEQDNNSEQDRTLLSGLLGVKWESSALTKLSILLGYQEADFDHSSFSNSTDFIWSTSLLWSPLDSTTIDINTSRSFTDSKKITNTLSTVTTYGVKLNYAFNDVTKFYSRLSFDSEEFTSESTRITEDFFKASFGINYQWKTRYSFYLRYDFNDFESDIVSNNYEKNSLALGFSASI